MISDKMQQALNDQLNLELYSAYVYLSMGAHFQHENLSGFASWMEAQAREETGHAAKFYKFINSIGGRVTLKAIEQPPTSFESPLSIFEQALEHEKVVTQSIHRLVALAREENDYATDVFLQWFVTEQVEEVAAADEIVKKLRLVGSDPRGLFMIDRQLAMRAQ